MATAASAAPLKSPTGDVRARPCQPPLAAAAADPSAAAVAAAAPPPDPLPSSYQRIGDAFDALERTLALFQSRGRPALYGMLQRPVESATLRDFTPAVLGAVLGVWPDGFTVRCVEQAALDNRLRASTMAASKRDWLVGWPQPAAPPPRAVGAGGDSAPAAPVGTPAAAAALREARAAEFRARLHGLVASHRAAWREAAERGEGGAPADAAEWDPEACPPPLEATLPPLQPAAPPRGGSAAPAAAGPSSAAAEAPNAEPAADGGADNGAGAAPVPRGCEGLPTALLEKIRRREREAGISVATAPQAQRAALLARLPQLATSLRACLREQKRRMAPEEEVIGKLLQNGKWLASAEQMREQIQMLAELVPEWLTRLVCPADRPGEQPIPTVRIDNAAKFDEVLERIRAAK